MYDFLYLLLFVVKTTSAFVPQAGTLSVRNDLKVLDSDYQKLRQAANSLSGSSGSFGFGAFQNAFDTVDEDTKKTTNDTNASPAFSSADAQTISDYINKTLEPDIKSALKAVAAAEPKFAAVGLLGVYENNLEQLRSDTDQLGSALISKSPSSKKQSLQQDFQKIDADFDWPNGAAPKVIRDASANSQSTDAAPPPSADFVQLNNDYRNLSSRVNTFSNSNSTVNALYVCVALNTCDKDTNTTKQDFQSSATLTAAQAQAIIDYINNPLEPSINTSMTALAASRPKWTNTDLISLACNLTKRLRNDTQALDTVMVSKFPAAKQSALQQSFNKITGDFNVVIRAFC